jgi:drug/metabolite transporter (DMT)-like permease
MNKGYAKGMLVMAASSVLFSAMSLLVPWTKEASTSVVTAARFITGILIIAGFAVSGITRLTARNRLWLVVRGVIGAVSVFLFFRGIVTLGLGKGTILNYTYPIFAALLAPLMLRERLHLDVLAAIGVSFFGIYLVLNPGNILAIGSDGLLALLGGALSGVAVVAIKKLRETDSPYMIYLAQCVFGLFVVGYPTVTSSFAFSAVTWLILLGVGLFATAAQLLMTWAYKHVPATEGSLLAFLVPVLNMILGVIVFGETMHPATIAGSLLVLASCVYVAFREKIIRLAR